MYRQVWNKGPKRRWPLISPGLVKGAPAWQRAGMR